MQISEQGLLLLKQSEGCRTQAYQDCVGVWTIGYGWTQSVEGIPIYAGMTISTTQAEQLLQQGLHRYEAAVLHLVKVSLTQGQFDALINFTYNVGESALAHSTLLKYLNAGNYAAAADEFLRWNWAKGQQLPGLTRRRQAEKELFLS
ncbi:lysozyme [Xenorhabdus nematophila]|uniref:Lysozyme n=1 Tax=Xenorhabdus nematophila (strain ATCC 19061 / DSM 3370 / CCUG 14189 / LMG 1036 / NCIMB 9965 / AN6) TaxID=406817 RepID=D3VGG3_XENNA|nr:lysozyme [Xenorhabdus nematophila]CEE89973.1 Gifsy-2 prophage lysozyme [Xenorhabdus nematophila str. Anatoliense]CBJ90399.1 Gifsy-2 prophage lysozyme [Xenorhabdus nematophila ATCC 19061]CCW32403.1 Lysozyme [Xenorhabdus nematophila F1]CEE95467.1 Gifsy-2 prophage lysozyme [Xenorhabdus nematophila str. Anatoliense]CEK23252.1 Gifsy-2 prophage lysozyme [Xenorhabdus nematophila AN6/1]